MAPKAPTPDNHFNKKGGIYRGVSMPMQRFLRSSTMLTSVVGATFISVMSAQAADSPVVKSPAPVGPLPAVDGINYRASIFGGELWRRGQGGVDGTVAIPLSHSYGLQIDGLASSWQDRFYGEVHGHWFWRDPAIGMLGLYAAYVHHAKFGGADVGYLGVEFGRYHGPWELKGVVGVESGNSGATLTSPNTITSFDIKTRWFDKIDLNYYLNENFKVGIGHRYISGHNALALRAEVAAPLGAGRMASIFVEGRAGEDRFKSVWAGLRIYLGNRDKPLIRRHREDMLNTVNEGINHTTRKANQNPCPSGEIFDPEYGCILD
jgi:hypothetical protein